MHAATCKLSRIVRTRSMRQACSQTMRMLMLDVHSSKICIDSKEGISSTLAMLQEIPSPVRWWAMDIRYQVRLTSCFLSPGQARIARVHASALPHEQSCRLLLRAHHRTFVHGANGVGRAILISQNTSPSIIHLGSNEDIQIGTDCTYYFKYTDFAESDQHKECLFAFMKTIHGDHLQSLAKLIQPTPSPTPMIRLNMYSWLVGAFAKGTFGQLAAGYKSNGDLVAVKWFRNPKEDKLSHHRKLMSHIRDHVRDILFWGEKELLLTLC